MHKIKFKKQGVFKSFTRPNGSSVLSGMKGFGEQPQWIGQPEPGLAGLPHHLRQISDSTDLGSTGTCQTNPRPVKLRSLARFHLDVCMAMFIQKMSCQNAALGRAGCTILVAGGWLAASTAGKQTLDLFQALPCGSPAARIRAKRKWLKCKFLDLLSAGSHNNDTQHLPDICSLDHLLLRRQQTLPFSSVLL